MRGGLILSPLFPVFKCKLSTPSKPCRPESSRARQKKKIDEKQIVNPGKWDKTYLQSSHLFIYLSIYVHKTRQERFNLMQQRHLAGGCVDAAGCADVGGCAEAGGCVDT